MCSALGERALLVANHDAGADPTDDAQVRRQRGAADPQCHPGDGRRGALAGDLRRRRGAARPVARHGELQPARGGRADAESARSADCRRGGAGRTGLRRAGGLLRAELRVAAGLHGDCHRARGLGLLEQPVRRGARADAARRAARGRWDGRRRGRRRSRRGSASSGRWRTICTASPSRRDGMRARRAIACGSRRRRRDSSTRRRVRGRSPGCSTIAPIATPASWRCSI